MKPKFFFLRFVLLLCLLCGSSGICQEKPTAMRPGVVLTFDDLANVEDWVQQIPLFAKYGATVTFFLDRADRLTPAKLAGVQQLAKAGHEIGCHGLRHLKATELIQKSGVDSFLQTEIEPAVDALRKAGITPRSYAYPMSQNSPESDQALKKFFSRVRSGRQLPAGGKLAETDTFFTPSGKIAERFCLVGKGIDRTDETILQEQIFPALHRAAERKEILVLYAHDIVQESPRHHIQPGILEQILKKAVEENLVFYTMGSLPSE